MEINIKSDRENKLFGRREVEFAATYHGSKTPSREEIKEEICKRLSLNPDTTVVIRIDQAYGSTASNVEVHSYSDKETMERLVKKRDKKGGKAKATKKEEQERGKEEKADEKAEAAEG